MLVLVLLLCTDALGREDWLSIPSSEESDDALCCLEGLHVARQVKIGVWLVVL
jgi:hypothetical protein